jgi:hypothetical protein
LRLRKEEQNVETMTATTLTPARRSLADAAAGDLVLRVFGFSRNGQIVRLRATKCTIGSGPQCTLRLRAPGVAPLHCLLLRGPAGTVARCWSADTRLNHRAFTDAAVVPGDRLEVGPIELEILHIGAASPVQQAEEHQDAMPRHADRQHQQLVAERAELETARNVLTEQQNSLSAQHSALAEQRQRWQTEQEEARRAAEQQRQQLAADRAELETARNVLAEQQNSLSAQHSALAEQRQRWQTEQEEARRAAEQHRQQLAAERAELEAARNVVAQQQSSLEARQPALTEQQNSLAAQQSALAEQRQRWHTEHEEARRTAEQQHQQLAAERAELEAARNVLAEQRNSLSAQHGALAQQRAQRHTEQEQAQQAAEQQRQQLAAERTELETARNVLAEQQNTLAVQQDALAEERRHWRAGQEKALQDAESQRQQLAAQWAELETAQHTLAEERRQLERQQAAPSPRENQQQADVEPSQAGAEPEDSTAPQPHELQFQESNGHAPANVADALCRADGEPESAEEDRSSQPEPAPTAVLQDAADDSSPPTTLSMAGEGEEESIDEYMGKLMQRIRVSAGEPAAPARAAVHAEPPRAVPIAPVNEPPCPPSTVPTAAVPTSEPVAVPPRAAAPEKRADLSVLRELANLSAHSALSRYARRVLVHSIYSKLMVAGVALVAGVGLLWLWRCGARPMTLYSGLLALLIAVWWGVEYALLTGRLIISKSGRIDIVWGGSARATKQGGASAKEHVDDDARGIHGGSD